jgi:sulfur carrier protein
VQIIGGTQAARKRASRLATNHDRREPRPLTEVLQVIEVNVNGAAQRFEPDTKVSALLERLQLAGKRVAVERNGEIVPRSRFAQTALADGDRLEIVVAVGGG